jgi:hypothetical protein
MSPKREISTPVGTLPEALGGTFAFLPEVVAI